MTGYALEKYLGFAKSPHSYKSGVVFKILLIYLAMLAMIDYSSTYVILITPKRIAYIGII